MKSSPTQAQATPTAPGIQAATAKPSSISANTLASQLRQVAAFLIALRSGQSWTTAQLAVEANQRTDQRTDQRAGVQAISFAVVRHLGQAQALRALLAPKKPPPAADALLTAALGLLCAQGEAAAQQGVAYADHVIVSQAVEAAKRDAKLARQASFINACLRRFLREREALLASMATDVQAQFNHPAWWVGQLQIDWPEQARSLLQSNLRPAPLTLRINPSKCSLAGMESALLATNSIANTDIQKVAHGGLQLAHSLPVSRLPGYQEGWFSVQDAAAQLAAPLLLQALPAQAQPWRILDACAAPGGKTSHLLEWAAQHQQAIDVTALDVDAQRCKRIEENLARLQFQARIVVADAAQVSSWHDGQPFDGILLDAPCTASGIVRRHPDIPWLRRESDIAGLAAQQKRLLQALWPVLKPGGALLYCTCSVFKAEGLAQIEAFVAHNTDAQSLPAPGHLLPLYTPVTGAVPDNGQGELGRHDGFFYALLRKRS